MPVDVLHGATASGSAARLLHQNDLDPNLLRPYRSDDPRDGNTYVIVNQWDEDKQAFQPTPVIRNAAPVNNAYASDLGISTLRVREWIQLDQSVLRVAAPRLGFVQDLRDNNLEYTIPNGMGRTVLQYQTQSAPGQATLSMDGLRRSKNDRPLYDLRSLPLPIAHEDFTITARELMTSRNNNTPLDTTMAEDAGIRVAELVERLALGTYPGITYGGATIEGLTNFTQRLTYVLSNPTSGGWTPNQTFNDVLAMKQSSMNDFHFGPWNLYCSHEWSQYLDSDYSAAYGNLSLRQRLMQIENLKSVKTLDFLTGYQMILVEMQSRTIREVIGMDITTLQWPGEGGMELNFKVMCIMVPQLRYDYNGNVGIVHGNVA